MLPLTNANLLAHAIVGSVLENLDMERLIREVGYAVAEKIHLNNESVDDVARELHEKLLLRNESTKHVVIENIYRDIPEAAHNVQVWLAAASIQEAKPQLKRVHTSTETIRASLTMRPDPRHSLLREIPRATIYAQHPIYTSFPTERYAVGIIHVGLPPKGHYNRSQSVRRSTE
jgi:hypothetical protein